MMFSCVIILNMSSRNIMYIFPLAIHRIMYYSLLLCSVTVRLLLNFLSLWSCVELRCLFYLVILMIFLSFWSFFVILFIYIFYIIIVWQ